MNTLSRHPALVFGAAAAAIPSGAVQGRNSPLRSSTVQPREGVS